MDQQYTDPSWQGFRIHLRKTFHFLLAEGYDRTRRRVGVRDNSGFRFRFLDFSLDFWISLGFLARFRVRFLDFSLDFWISLGFLDFLLDFYRRCTRF